MSNYAEIPQHIKDLADARAEIERLRDEIEELRERMREAAKLNMGLMDIRRDNEAEIERLRETIEAMSIYNGTQHAEIERLRDHIKFLNSFRPDAELARLRGLLRECLDNDAATSIVEYDPSVPGCARTSWSSDDWNKRVREALGE